LLASYFITDAGPGRDIAGGSAGAGGDGGGGSWSLGFIRISKIPIKTDDDNNNDYNYKICFFHKISLLIYNFQPVPILAQCRNLAIRAKNEIIGP